MEILLIFLGIIAVIVVIFLAVIPQTKFGKAVNTLVEYHDRQNDNSETNKHITHTSLNDDKIDEIYYRDKNYEYIIDIVSKCGHNRPVKLSQFLQDIGQTQRQSDLYVYLTSEKFRSEYYFLNISKIENERKPDLILSVNDENLNSNNDEDENLTSDNLEDILFDLEEYTENDDSIELPIRGINFRNLTDANIGSFNGYIMPDKENKHDRYAIGVYSDDDTHFGFIEKGQKSLYNKIESGYGYINGRLEIDTFIDEDTGETRFHGIITIDKELLL